MATITSRPPIDPEIAASLSKLLFPQISGISDEIVSMMRTATATPPSFLDDLASRGIAHREATIGRTDGSDSLITLSILQPASEPTKPRPCLYWMHGGGLHWGDRLHTLEMPTDIILECDAVCVSVEYRLAPEHSYSATIEDCYSGLKWTREHAQELGIDIDRIMVGGTSAGGGLAAATAILCRDRGGPKICAQCLICPMLDDRVETVSSRQFANKDDFISRDVFTGAWKSTLAKEVSGKKITPPGRMEDLSGLPTAYLDAGSAEVLRDETVAYASKLWEKGVQAELHIWAGGIHGFDIFFPSAEVAQDARRAQVSWFKRVWATNKT
ncbi:esterase LipW [Xylogone sp. PMI_703]|nr:esterase LipW [Xylogone sp. PMI_703]